MLGQACRPTKVGLEILAWLILAWNSHLTLAADSNLTEPQSLEILKTPTPLVLELTDTSLISEVWSIVNPDSDLPRGEFQILLNESQGGLGSGDQEADDQEKEEQAVLLLNGTEIGRLDRAEWQRLASKTLQDKGEGWISSSQGADRQEVPLVWKAVKLNPKALLAGMQWPSGLLLGMSTTISALPTAKLQAQRDLDFDLSQKLFDHFLLGLGVHNSQFGGGLTYAAMEAKRRAVQPATNTQTKIITFPQKKTPYWGEDYWWWSLTVGIPGLKYTLALADQPLPKYFWLETRALPAIKTRKSGRIIKQWTESSLEKSGNFSHTFDTRLGYLRYGFHYDTDAYKVPIQTIYLDDMPALFGTWGTGLVMASDILATRVWMNIPDLALNLPYPATYPSNFKFVFARLDLAYRSIRNFNLGISVHIRIDNPILNLPGA